MNVATDPWIPVVLRDGRTARVSLRDAFTRGEEIADLAVRPHEKIAVLRLLICVGQAALDGPETEDDWEVCLPRLPEAAAEYLESWKKCFELFGDGPRFLQVRGEGAIPCALEKLDFIDEKTTTLFDHETAPDRPHSPEWIALKLLTYQSFAAGGKVGGIDDKNRPQSGLAAVCRDGSAYHAFVRMPHLLQTVHANLVSRENGRLLAPLHWEKGIDRPVWEFRAANLGELVDHPEVVTSYPARQCPLSRALWLLDDRSAENANGLRFPLLDAGCREPSTAVRLFAKERRVLVSAKGGTGVAKAVWRELAAITVRAVSADGPGGPLCLLRQTAVDYDLYAGAFIGDQAKPVDVLESTLRVPAAMSELKTQAAYTAGVEFAERWARKVGDAVKAFRQDIEGHTRSKGGVSRKSKGRGQLNGKAQTFFWNALEHGVSELRAVAIDPSPHMEAGAIQWTRTAWGSLVIRSAREAYEYACPSASPRLMKAFAAGLRELDWKREPPHEAEPEPEEKSEES